MDSCRRARNRANTERAHREWRRKDALKETVFSKFLVQKLTMQKVVVVCIGNSR